MESLLLRPQGPLKGIVRAGGAKNSALKLMAATLLAEGSHVLRNVPQITDVAIMAEVIEALGAKVSTQGSTLTIVVPATEELVAEAPYELVEQMRASIVVLGPLLARCGRARVSMPGGDDIGSRPIDIHVDGLVKLGVNFRTLHGYLEGSVTEGRLVGQNIVLEYPSHTATDNLLMAAVLAKGTTVIENAAREPEVEDLAVMLNKMGAKISGLGSSRLVIEGVEQLSPADHAVIPDRVVAATYLLAAAISGGSVTITDGRPDHMEMLLAKLAAMGADVSMTPEGLRLDAPERLLASDVATLPYPGVATDYKPLIVAALSVADGVSIVSENLFEGRFRYIDELRRMGADIRTEGHHAVIRGVPSLSGAPVRAPDIRAGAALVLAGLVAEGSTEISGIEHIDRGYESLELNLTALGASVERRS
ncbi:MAG: UDP-N-acetylglucosamine 1-carboxyvinyltransferase [Actinobacteria bacterium]|nr:UDP-N-acetylglucosamine 1-carboxyvinyltransferase [Actinomycetota bacterium]